ncbi:MAG: hypothetical protein QM817_34930 [Archangium sp.]
MKISIAAPCNEKWEAMTPVAGNDRQRHCASCKLNVFNTKNLSEAELEALLTKTEGRVCGRIWQRADGTVITKDCPRGLALLRKRALAAFTMAATLVLAVIGFAFVRGKGKACAVTLAEDEDATWFDRVVTTRAIDAREELRTTHTLGPLVDKLFPVPVVPRVMMGKMKYVPPTTTALSE